MKKAIIFLFLIPFISSAQESEEVKIGRKDSIKLERTFKKLIKAIVKKDEVKVMKISLPELYCVECFMPEDESSAYISAKEHYDALHDFTNTATYKSLFTKGYGFKAPTLRR